MSSEKPEAGDRFYLPFWVLLEYLDNTPSDPFIVATVINTKVLNATSSEGVRQVNCCDLECISHSDKKNSFTVCNVPVDYLIPPDLLKEWADKISRWFLDYTDHCKS